MFQQVGERALRKMGRRVMLCSHGMKSQVRLGSMWSAKCSAIPDPLFSLWTCSTEIHLNELPEGTNLQIPTPSYF